MKKLTIRVSDTEHEQLVQFCKLTERTQNDVLRQCVRSLAVSGALNPIDSPAIPAAADLAGTARGS